MEFNDLAGVAGKHGFYIQVCIAADHVTQVLRDKTTQRIRCEVISDIDIVYDGSVDFVKAKKKGTILIYSPPSSLQSLRRLYD